MVWTCSHFMPAATETNNSAEYTALLVGVEAAVQHGVTHLRVEGDSTLVLSQVRGTYACSNPRLRRFRDKIRAVLRKISHTRLVHIDRQANEFADRAANRALDRKRTLVECGQHPNGGDGCCHPEQPLVPPRAARQQPEEAKREDDEDDEDGDDPTDVTMSEEDDAMAHLAARDDGELFEATTVTAETFPARQPRLRLKKLSDDEYDAAAEAVDTMARVWAVKISDAPDWAAAEGYIEAIPAQLRHVLRPYCMAAPSAPRPRPATPAPRPRPSTTPGPPARSQTRPQTRPPRVTRHQREHRLDEALDDMAAVQRADPTNQTAIHRARRRVARIRTALGTTELRKKFTVKERECVEEIFRRADPEAAAATDAPTTPPFAAAELHEHFTRQCTPATAFNYDGVVGAQFRNSITPRSEEQEADALADAPTVGEVEDQLKRTNGSTSPGHDGIGYDVLKRFGTQLAPLLAAAFASCWQHQQVPAVWKVGNVRLLHKKGAPTDVANWRPICLQPTLYKLYTGLLAKRLSRWLEANGQLPMSQKGFRSFNGCHENNFLSTSLLDQARRVHRKLYLLWYDLKDAFGSLPQQLMWKVLDEMGAPAAFVTRCSSLYEAAYFTITNATDGGTRPIARNVGVFQGCPLSPLLFITAMAPLLRRLEQLVGVGVQLAPDQRPCAAAYADDIKIFCDSADGIRRCHRTVTEFLSWTGLRANAKKCASLSVTTNLRGNPELDASVVHHIDNEAIPTLTLGDTYSYLGVGDGFDHVRHRLQLAPKFKQIQREAVALLRSELAPWQVLKAIKVYVYPKVEYALRHLRPSQSQLEGFDRAMTRGLRHMLKLPRSATNEFLHAPTSSGGLGIMPLTEMHAALQVAHAWQMLHSQDPAIRAIARQQVVQICQVRHKLDKDHWVSKERRDELVQRFLNSTLATSPFAPAKRRNGDIASLWVDVQRHLRTWGLALDTHTVDAVPSPLHLQVPHHTKWLDHKTVLRHLKLHIKLRHLKKWREMVDQGRTVRVHGGTGSKFVTSGAGLTDGEYKFAVSARLNQLDTNSVLKRRHLRANATCRAPDCAKAETLAHVLNHCEPNMAMIRQRHDAALAQIEAAIKHADHARRSNCDIRLDSTVPEFDGPAWRPDIQIRNATTKTVVIADLAITCEDQGTDTPASSSLQHSREYKVAKYEPIAAALRRQGWTVHMEAVIYGSMGSVHPANMAVFTDHFGMLKRDARRLDAALSSHCIRSSRRVWNWHCAQHRTRQHNRRHATGSGGNPRGAAPSASAQS